MSEHRIEASRAAWNRGRVDLASDEVLAQLLDRGDMDDWRFLYRLAAGDAGLRTRIKRVVLSVPLPLPHFWLAALKSLGEEVDFDARLPDYGESLV